MDIPYIPGSGSPLELPFERFIPPVPAGMAEAWCKKYLSTGDWILEPFGFNPMVLIEIAAAGFPILATINNPIHAFLLKILASAPQKESFIAAFQDLAVAPKGDERMEPYIRGLYSVNCADCKRKIEAESFLWEKDAKYPFAAQVNCPYCGAVADQDISEEDKAALDGLPPIQLHRARALNRIIGQDNELHHPVMNALNAYPSRPLIVLQTMINKLDSLEQSERRRELLIALILSAADAGNTLWAYPSPRSRPRQIVVPNTYQERNLWKVMERAIDTWQVIKTPIPIYTWGEAPPEPHGIHLFGGRFRELSPKPDKDFFSAVIAAIPRPNQAFWTLSALWTGWIWGQEAVEPIRNVLTRQRYDWNWHTNALSGVFDNIKSYFNPGLKTWGLVAENEPMLLLATLLAANTSGYLLSAFSDSLDDQIAQCYWRIIHQPLKTVRPDQAMATLKQHVKSYLLQKGEPANYQQIHTAAITGLANEKQLGIDIFLQNSNSAASETQRWIEGIFTEADLLERVGGGKASLETGEWWLRQPENQDSPLIDRVEEKILRYLFENKEVDAQEIKDIIYQAFPGRFTPTNKTLITCLESYADLIDPDNHLWRLKDNENPHVRKAEVEKIKDLIRSLGNRMTYKSMGDAPISWFDTIQTDPIFSFYVISTAIVSESIRKKQSNAQRKILVLPGSRANLLAFKKERDPVLANLLDRDFLAVKFRLIRDLEANPLLTRDLFTEQIRVDPPEYRSSQLALF